MLRDARTTATLSDVNVLESCSSVSLTEKRRLRIGFVMEDNVGHTTWHQNLLGAITAFDGLETRWVGTTLFDPEGLVERVPGVPDFVRGGVRALLDVRRGLSDWPRDVLIFNTQKTAMFSQWDMLRTPTILMTDVTPSQYDRMGKLYGHAPDRSPGYTQTPGQRDELPPGARRRWLEYLDTRLACRRIRCAARAGACHPARG